MTDCTSFLLDLEGNQRRLIESLLDRISLYPSVSCKLRYKIPFFYCRSWFCYLNPIKGDGVELAFIYGNEMADPTGLLQARGRKQVMGVYLYDLSDLSEETLDLLIAEALVVDEQKKSA